MESLYALYLEDNESDFEIVSQIFKFALDPIDLRFEPAKSPQEAINLLREKGSEFQIFFVDLLMPEQAEDGILKENKAGLTAVDVASKFSHIAIIGVSKAEGSHPGTRSEFERRAGQDCGFLDKREIKNGQPLTEIRSEIERVLTAKGYTLSKETLTDLKWEPGVLGNEKLDAEIGTVGKETMRRFLGQIAPECSSFSPYYIAPGFSGAGVLRVEGHKQDGRKCRNLLIKFSRDRKKLKQELDSAPAIGEPSSAIYVPYMQGGPWEDKKNGEYWAIAARFEEDAITLNEWLLDPSVNPRSHSVQEVFEQLFLRGGLEAAYSQGNKLYDKTAIELLKPSDKMRARVLIGIDFIEKVLPVAKINIDLTDIRNFVRFKGQIRTHPNVAYPMITYECLSHGDLHTRNILVTVPIAHPLLIDTGSRRQCHWALDPARLCTDLWMTNWDSVPHSYFWANLKNWRRDIQLWREGHNIHIDSGSQNIKVYEALCWLRDNLPNIFGDSGNIEFTYWQFNLALALEFLSMSSYPEVPMPKRCLGLLAANDIILWLDQEIPWL